MYVFTTKTEKGYNLHRKTKKFTKDNDRRQLDRKEKMRKKTKTV